ncbi:MAG: threonine--tRNA ligase [Candidatus Berkelbacteria bacterium]|nr:threonine--tRNA ligase [Candidatus Berkelbacteria bacterium]
MNQTSDHKVFGREFKLFTFSRTTPGFAFWHPRGVILYDIIVNYIRGLLSQHDYFEIRTPSIFDTELWKKSGHFDNYKDKMYFCADNVDNDLKWGIKPMNCPESCLVFNEYVRTYKDLPLRFSEFELLHRYEQAGEINGLFRMREFMIDDAHIYCQFDQIGKEIDTLINLIGEVYKKFGFKEYKVELSTRPKKFIGDEKQWKKSEEILRKILKSKKLHFKENKGEGAFYGPKIDFHIEDSLKRSWQLGTIQLDFATAERLEVNYIDRNGKKNHPVMIHRALLGSIERFIAILLEHYKGALPVWLSPVQAVVIPISDKYSKYAKEVYIQLKKNGFRPELDEKNDTLQKKIRNAEIQKIPYMLVIGEKEVQSKKISVRDRVKGNLGQMEIEEFNKRLL